MVFVLLHVLDNIFLLMLFVNMYKQKLKWIANVHVM